MVEQMVTILPSLERLWLPVFEDVSGLFALSLDSFSLSHYSKSPKSSLPSSASRTLHVNLFRREGKRCVDQNDVSFIATNLRQSNSCFSFIEIWEDVSGGWENTVFVWEQVSGVFYRVGSVTVL